MQRMWMTAGVLLVCAAGISGAQEPPPMPGGGQEGGRGGRERRGDPAQRIQRLLQRFDKDGDGALSKEELPERFAERLMRADADGDGKITPEEFTKAAEQRRAERGAGDAGDGSRGRGAFGMRGTFPEGTRELKDLAYGEHGKQKLDLYLPPGTEVRPLVIYIHGGGWRGGDKRSHGSLYRWLAERGYAVASVNYRLSGSDKYPACIDDCTAAVRWLRSKAGEYQFDSKRIGLIGSSAGGHLVALLAVRNLEGAGVTCVVSYYGAHELNQTTGEGVQANTKAPAELIGGTVEEKPAQWKEASCSTHVTKDDPPFLLIHGDKDTTVPLSESVEFQKKLTTAGVACELITVKNGGHGLNSRSGEEISPKLEEVDAKLEAFLKKHLLK